MPLRADAVVLYQFLEQWKAKNGGVAPKVYKEKRAFRDELQVCRPGV